MVILFVLQNLFLYKGGNVIVSRVIFNWMWYTTCLSNCPKTHWMKICFHFLSWCIQSYQNTTKIVPSTFWVKLVLYMLFKNGLRATGWFYYNVYLI